MKQSTSPYHGLRNGEIPAQRRLLVALTPTSRRSAHHGLQVLVPCRPVGLPPWRRPHRVLLMRGMLLVSAVALALAAPASAHAFDRPSPGAAGIGDRLYPTLGNGGYDVRHYDLDLRYATSAPTQGGDGAVTILAVATQSLSRFDLDFAGDSVGSVAVDGLPAAFQRDGEDLVITPRLPLLKGLPFVVQVRHFTAHPSQPDPNTLLSTPFIVTPDGSVTAGQPNATHDFLPSNDHPRDKA